jgi:hypothetical protein
LIVVKILAVMQLVQYRFNSSQSRSARPTRRSASRNVDPMSWFGKAQPAIKEAKAQAKRLDEHHGLSSAVKQKASESRSTMSAKN